MSGQDDLDACFGCTIMMTIIYERVLLQCEEPRERISSGYYFLSLSLSYLCTQGRTADMREIYMYLVPRLPFSDF